MEENKLKQEVRYTDSVVAQEPLFPQVKVNLNSPDGNAIVIMAVVNHTLEATNYAPELRSKVLSEMKQASSYQNLCDIAGHYISLYCSENYEMESSIMKNDDFFKKEVCDRCGASLKRGRIISMFNLDVLCQECKDKERERPDYRKANDAVWEEERKSNRNFEGIGLK